MARIASLVVAGGLLLTQGAASAAVIIPQATVTVRVYGAMDVPLPVMNRALAGAAATIARADVDIHWTYCDAAHAGQAGCERPLRRDEFALRFIRSRGDDRSARRPLGDALIDTATGNGALATVYLDRVAWLAREAGTDVPTLLGRAVAHELTHLLLGSSRHEGRGLMRAVWSCDDLRAALADWGLTARQRSAIYAAALKRADLQ